MDGDHTPPAGPVTVGPYRLRRLIGQGGMGEVHEALDEALDRRVALKLIAPHLAGDPAFRARFVREARALAALDSAHVVGVHAHGEADGRLYLATQLVPDGDLAQLLRRDGPLPVAAALDVVAQVAAGLRDVHAAGLAHRDVKPANVLLRRRGAGLHAYLGDFGVARPVGAVQTRTGVAGTPLYMAPELHTGAGADARSDVYSAGCVLWAALTGRAPYTAGTDYQLATAHLREPVPQLAGRDPLTLRVNRVLRLAMAKDPADRCPSASALRDELLRAGRPADNPVAVGCRRRGVLPVAACAAAATALVGGLTWAGLPGAEPAGREDLAPRSRDRAVATGSLADALVRVGPLTRRQARCIAERWIAEVGLRPMVSAGYFDADLRYVDLDRRALTPAIEDAAGVAARACSDR